MSIKPECSEAKEFYGITLYYCSKHDHLIPVYSGPSGALPVKYLEAGKLVSEAVEQVLERHEKREQCQKF